MTVTLIDRLPAGPSRSIVEFGRYAERRTGMAEKPGYDRNWNVKKEYGDCRIITVVADENFLLEKFL